MRVLLDTNVVVSALLFRGEARCWKWEEHVLLDL